MSLVFKLNNLINQVDFSSASMALDYSERDLDHLPNEFFNLEDLEMVTELDLSHNHFQSLPLELFKVGLIQKSKCSI